MVCEGPPSDEADDESVRAIAGAVKRDGDSLPWDSSSGIVMWEVGGCSSSILVWSTRVCVVGECVVRKEDRGLRLWLLRSGVELAFSV